MQLLASSDSNDRNSLAIYWPGGEGELHAVGDFDGGTVTLYHAPLYVDEADAGQAAQYNAHGATLSGSTKYNQFKASEGYLYVGFAGGDGGDAFTCGIDYQGRKVNQQPRFTTDDPVA